MDKITLNLTKAIEEKTNAWQRLSIDEDDETGYGVC